MKLQVKDLLDTANAKDIYVTITNDCAIPLLDCDAAVLECTIINLYANSNDVVLTVDEKEFVDIKRKKYMEAKAGINAYYGLLASDSSIGGITRKSSNK